ncbi:hypothetical protein JJB07_00665 [Tumebacillus sp. ITR2]|uniref:Metalloprotease TldD/E C-terminal domain-containing protein n=1 Tax=Tumebacillus amylolyticus TaxID=2801339 RepID=A0ABS1J4E2_9BACL|nr:metallopeptidase TldD-related protein [Tumebacillus amylolyticus]MBL0385143.1 hypothetical protein [Tumebacillus amylolyticus]
MSGVLPELQSLFDQHPLLQEVTWKTGESFDCTQGGLHYPIVPASHQGGRLLLFDGTHRGQASFQTFEEVPNALAQAQEQLAARVFAATLLPEEQEPLILTDGAPATIDAGGMLSLLEELHENTRVEVNGNPIFTTLSESVQASYYLNKNGRTLIRHELSSRMQFEHVDAAAKSLRIDQELFNGTVQELLRERLPLLMNTIRPRQVRDVEFAAGRYPCLMTGDVAGFFLHEVVGHLFEADMPTGRFLRERRGRRVAPLPITVSDAPDHLFDDEGILTKRTPMIEEGSIGSLLHSKASALQFGDPPNGHGRSYRGWHSPIPRMHHTLMEAGDADEAALRSEFPRTVLLERASNAVCRNGNFTLQIKRAKLLEHSVVVADLDDVIVHGSGLEALRLIVGVGATSHRQALSCWKNQQDGLVVSATAPELLFQSLWIGKG